ncbi:MAG TPA: hypothetical protein VGM91_16545 [Conexibacter sp.]|jgi:hypothetical protein
MGFDRDDSYGPPRSALSADIAAHVEAIVRAAEQEAHAAQRAIDDRRRGAEDEVRRYLAAARLQVDAEAAARAARLETLSAAAHRLADELADAAAALNAELRRGDDSLRSSLPRTPWVAEQGSAGGHERPSGSSYPREMAPHAAAAQPYAAASQGPHEPSWSRATPPPPPPRDAADAAPDAAASAGPRFATEPVGPADVPNAARLVAIEMAVGGAARADVEEHLRARFGVAAPAALLDDVFGAESHASSRLAWGEP